MYLDEDWESWIVGAEGGEGGLGLEMVVWVRDRKILSWRGLLR